METKTLEKIAEEKRICVLLFLKGKRTQRQDKECFDLMMNYQTKYKHPFPISVIDKYIEKQQ